MAKSKKEELTYSTTRTTIVTVFGVGAFVGFFGWLLTLGIHNWMLTPVFCRSADTASICTNSGAIAWGIAYSIMSVAGLFLLVRANVFRPLLVVLAALVTLWLVGEWLLSGTWWTGLLWEAGLFAVAYMLYTWLASIRRFAVALLVVVLVAVGMRLLLTL